MVVERCSSRMSAVVKHLVHLDLAQPCAQLLVLARHLFILIVRWMAVVLLKVPGGNGCVVRRWGERAHRHVAGGGTHFSQRRRRRRMNAFVACCEARSESSGIAERKAQSPAPKNQTAKV